MDRVMQSIQTRRARLNFTSDSRLAVRGWNPESCITFAEPSAIPHMASASQHAGPYATLLCTVE